MNDYSGNTQKSLYIGGTKENSYTGIRYTLEEDELLSDTTDLSFSFLTKHIDATSTDGVYVYIEFYNKNRMSGSSADIDFNRNHEIKTLKFSFKPNCTPQLELATRQILTYTAQNLDKKRWYLYSITYSKNEKRISAYINNTLVGFTEFEMPLADSALVLQLGRTNIYNNNYPNSLSPMLIDNFYLIKGVIPISKIDSVSKLLEETIAIVNTQTTSNDLLSIVVVPNPVETFISLIPDIQIFSLHIYNGLGEEVKSEKNLMRNEINVLDLPYGVYFLQGEDLNYRKFTSKFIKI